MRRRRPPCRPAYLGQTELTIYGSVLEDLSACRPAYLDQTELAIYEAKPNGHTR